MILAPRMVLKFRYKNWNYNLKFYKTYNLHIALKMSINETITIDNFLERIKNAQIVLIYEYYNGLEVSIDDDKVEYLIKTEEYRKEQYQIFEEIKSIKSLTEFKYTSRFDTELDYETLSVPSNLCRLTISHMEKISDVKQLGNIEALYLEGNASFNVMWLNLLPKTLREIEISSLEVENQEEYDKIIEYFNVHKIKYYIDNYCNYTPKN